MNQSILAIIPARGGSRGIPRKNLKMVGGKTLVTLATEQALESKLINRVIISTEDDEISAVAKEAGAEVMGRSEEFIHDNSTQEVDRLLVWTIKQLEEQGSEIDIVVLLYPTSPLRRTETIDAVVKLVSEKNYDSALTLCEDSSYLWRRSKDVVEPTNYVPAERGPRQRESWNQWVENKAVYAMRRELLMETGCRLGGRIGYVEMSKLESIDIDSPEDLQLCDLILKHSLLTTD